MAGLTGKRLEGKYFVKSMKKQFQLANRREFFGETVRRAALTVALASGSGRGDAATTARSTFDSSSRAERTDPKVIAYEEVTHWKSPHAQPRRIGEKDAERGITGFGVPSPFLGIVLGSDGLLYVNNLGHHRVEACTFDGDLGRTWGKPSLAIDGFCGCCNPIGVAVLPDGRFVTCEKGLQQKRSEE